MNLLSQYKDLTNDAFITNLGEILALHHKKSRSTKLQYSHHRLYANAVHRFFSNNYYDHSKLLYLIKLNEKTYHNTANDVLSIIKNIFIKEYNNPNFLSELEYLIKPLSIQISYPDSIADSPVFFKINDTYAEVLDTPYNYRFVDTYFYFLSLKEKGYTLEYILNELTTSESIEGLFILIILKAFNSSPYTAILLAPPNIKPIILKLIG